MFAQAGKLGIPGIVFACDTEPVVVTKSPHDWVTLRPRRIELQNVERLREIDFCQVVCRLAGRIGGRARMQRLKPNLSLVVEHIVFLTGHGWRSRSLEKRAVAGHRGRALHLGGAANSACRWPR